MEEQIRKVIDEVEPFGREHDARQTDHARKMLNLEPETCGACRTRLPARSRTWSRFRSTRQLPD